MWPTWCSLKLEAGLVSEGHFKNNHLLHDSPLTIFPVTGGVTQFFPLSYFHLSSEIENAENSAISSRIPVRKLCLVGLET